PENLLFVLLSEKNNQIMRLKNKKRRFLTVLGVAMSLTIFQILLKMKQKVYYLLIVQISL
ncbi:MAG TPA: hypothetical protein DCZ23_02855, partial [Lachnospiraceae bacterium]|nr:hypothetical protein [Lachnospiraceae bacterium]